MTPTKDDISFEQVKSNIPKTSVRIGAGGIVNTYGPVCPNHYHDEIELLPIFAGEFVAEVEGKRYTAKAGEVIFLNSKTPHFTIALGEHSNALIQFRESDFISSEITKIVKYSARLKNLSNDGVKIIRSKEFFDYTRNIIEEYKKKDVAYEIYIRAGIYNILAYLYRANILSDAEQMYNTKEVQKILPALSHINKHYNENITLEEMSALLSFDSSYFCRVFKSATGATFTEYLNFVRICRAEKLLSSSQSSILEISEAVGFSSVSYFNRIFKKYRHCSPKHYRSMVYANI